MNIYFEGVCFELTSSWSPARVEGWVPSRGPNPISAGTRRHALTRVDEFPDRIFCRQAAYISNTYSELGGPKMREMMSNSIWGPIGAHGAPRGAHGVEFVLILIDLYRFWLICIDFG